MIKFFRRFRQQFISQGKVSKYLLYAFGEIILVVVGILIALSINNWKENQRKASQESYYLKSLRASIIQDTVNFNTKLGDIALTMEEIDQARVKLNQEENEEIWTDKVPRIFMSTYNVNAETSVIEDLKSTGNLNLISNKKLIDSMLIYYKGINQTQLGIHNSLQTYARETIGPYLMMRYEVVFNDKPMYTGNSTAPVLSSSAFREDIFLINALGYRNSILTGLQVNYQLTLERARNILELLNKEIGPER